MTVIDLPQSSGHKPAPATYHAPLVHFPPYNPEFEFDFDEDEDDLLEEERVEPPVRHDKPKPISITIMPSVKPKRTRSRTRHTQSQPCSPRPSALHTASSSTMQVHDAARRRPPLHTRAVSVSSSTLSSPELLTPASPSSLPRGYFSSHHGRQIRADIRREPSLKA